VIRALLADLLAVAVLAVAAKPVAAHSPEEVQALVEHAADYIRVHGRQQAFADFSRPDGGFVNGDLYVFCLDKSGIDLANGGNPKLVGHNLSGVRGPDGHRPNVELSHLGQTQGSGWLEYRWPHIASGRGGRKAAYIIRIDDHTVCGSGYYKPD
jgi:cytochrome c